MCWGHSDKQNGVFPALSQFIAYRGWVGDRQANESVLIKPHKLTSTGGRRVKAMGSSARRQEISPGAARNQDGAGRQVNRLRSMPVFTNVGLIPGTPGS